MKLVIHHLAVLIPNVVLKMNSLFAHACHHSKEIQLLDVTMSVKVIMIAVLVNIVKTSSVLMPAINVVKVLYVTELLIIVHNVNVQRHILVHHLLNVVLNVMVMSIVHLQNQHAFMELVRILVTEHVVSMLIVI